MNIDVFKNGILNDVECFVGNVKDNKSTKDLDKRFIDWLASFVEYVKGACCGDEQFRDEYYEKQYKRMKNGKSDK